MNASHSTQDALRLDRLVHVETVCPKNGNLNGENMGNSWSTKSTGFGKVWSRRRWSICRSMSHDKIKTTASTTFEGNTPKSRTTARHPNNCGLRTTKYHKAHRGTPAFHTNTGLASYTIYHLPIIYHHLSVGCFMMSFRKTKPRPTGRGQQNWLANHLMIWARGCCSQAKGSRPEIGGAPVTATGMPVKRCKYPANASTFCELFIIAYYCHVCSLEDILTFLKFFKSQNITASVSAPRSALCSSFRQSPELSGPAAEFFWLRGISVDIKAR